MTPPPVERSTAPVSRRARAIYLVARLLLSRMVLSTVFAADRQMAATRIARLGRRVNRIARLQRVLPFRRFRLTTAVWNGLRVETVSLRDVPFTTDAGIILYFHGGGFVLGDLNTHIRAVTTLARATRLPVVHIDYRQFPAVDLATSIQDCLDAYRTLLDRHVDPTKVIIAGDSAGGFLAFSTAQRAAASGLPAPAGVVGISPLLELDNTARVTHASTPMDVFGLTAVLPILGGQLWATDDLAHQLEPVSGPVEAMPPALIVASSAESLLSDAERMQVRMTEAGRHCDVVTWPSQLHAFPAIFPRLPESRQAFARIACFIADRLSPAADEPRSRPA